MDVVCCARSCPEPVPPAPSRKHFVPDNPCECGLGCRNPNIIPAGNFPRRGNLTSGRLLGHAPHYQKACVGVEDRGDLATTILYMLRPKRQSVDICQSVIASSIMCNRRAVNAGVRANGRVPHVRANVFTCVLLNLRRLAPSGFRSAIVDLLIET